MLVRGISRQLEINLGLVRTTGEIQGGTAIMTEIRFPGAS
jgi:hypothetical protein